MFIFSKKQSPPGITHLFGGKHGTERKRKMKNAPHCEDTCIHNDILNEVISSLPSDEDLCDLSELFKVFGDSTRIKILYALMEDEMCVCDIAELLHMTQSAISHQLRVLKQASLVKYRKEGKTVYYSLADDHVHIIIAKGMEHIKE